MSKKVVKSKTVKAWYPKTKEGFLAMQVKTICHRLHNKFMTEAKSTKVVRGKTKKYLETVVLPQYHDLILQGETIVAGLIDNHPKPAKRNYLRAALKYIKTHNSYLKTTKK